MSLDFQVPEPEEPVYSEDITYDRAYREYLEGMVFRDCEQLRWAGNVIAASEFPLARRVAMNCRLLEDAVLSHDDAELARVTRFSHEDVVRSYVYSGLDIDAGVVLLTTQLLGIAKAELKGLVSPCATNLESMFRANAQTLSKEEKQDARYYGRRALLDLGLGSFSLRLASKLHLLH